LPDFLEDDNCSKNYIYYYGFSITKNNYNYYYNHNYYNNYTELFFNNYLFEYYNNSNVNLLKKYLVYNNDTIITSKLKYNNYFLLNYEFPNICYYFNNSVNFVSKLINLEENNNYIINNKNYDIHTMINYMCVDYQYYNCENLFNYFYLMIPLTLSNYKTIENIIIEILSVLILLLQKIKNKCRIMKNKDYVLIE